MRAQLVEKALSFRFPEDEVCDRHVERCGDAREGPDGRHDEPALQLRDVPSTEAGLFDERVEREVRRPTQALDAGTDRGREWVRRDAVTRTWFRRHAETHRTGLSPRRGSDTRTSTSAIAQSVLMAASDELFETRRDALGELPRTARADAFLEDRETRALFLLAVVDEELAQHADARVEREVAGPRDKQSFERVAKERVLLERLFLRAVRSMGERVDQLLFRERMADDLVGESTEKAALRFFFRLVEQVDDAAVLSF
jgi:hypothetical protein